MVRQLFDILTKKKILDEVDKGLKNFIYNCNNTGVTVNSILLKEKAKELSEKSGQFEFKASNGYLHNFTHRSSFCFKNIHGESGSVNPDVLISWKVKLNELIEILLELPIAKSKN
ncbi:tigger transposable element-derived 6-like [Brachionus plicatilis]|uniref:Tigger transposable element-derived 6-like n=1 Tax=Brachionus plicatilis TaxID=10195 RepID=A0A3M7SA59_BRAPC|nr:tigger transposable element-derived 6-like [Brachionus plicatilis]